LRKIVLPAVAALLFLSACAQQKNNTINRYFWPLPVAGTSPQVEYIDFYQSDYDVKLDSASWADENVWGQFPPRAIFFNPFDVSSYSGDRVFVTDLSSRRVLILDRENREVRELKDMNGETHPLLQATSVAASADGSVYVVDTLMAKVFKYDAEEHLIAKLSDGLFLSRPVAVAVDDRHGLVYVVDVGAHNVVVSDQQGTLLFKFGERGSEVGQFNYPTDIALDKEGNVYVLDSLNFRVQVFSPSGEFLREFGEHGTSPGSFQIPKGIAVSTQGHVYVTDALSNKFVVFDTEGNYLLTLGDKAYHLDDEEVTPGGFYAPRGIDVDVNGAIWVVDGMNKMVHQLQYLTEDYLNKFPIVPEQVYFPPGTFVE
jgi:sugar lactone lactonase YvrE